MAHSSIDETLGFGLSAAVTETAEDMSIACLKRAQHFLVVVRKLTEAGELFRTADFSAGLEKIQEASDFLDL